MSTIAAETPTDILRRIWEEYAAQQDTRAERHQTLQRMARVIVGLNNLALLDTETTGIGPDDEVVEIAIITGTGGIILHTLIRPTRPIPPEATRVHGISNADVRDAPRMSEVAPEIANALEGKFVVAYNAAFDFRALNQSFKEAGVKTEIRRRSRKREVVDVDGASVDVMAVESACVMRLYAAWNGDRWSSGTFIWQKLEDAVRNLGLEYEGRAHGALSDAKMTLAVLRRMARVDLGTI